MAPDLPTRRLVGWQENSETSASSILIGYNHIDRHAGFEEVELVDTFEFQPNQPVIFIKTFNSWYSVRARRDQQY